MKKNRLILLGFILALTSCGAQTPTIVGNEINIDDFVNSSQNTGNLSEFHLEDPLNDVILENVSIFRWSASQNAETYTLEISSSDRFISNVDTVDYYKRDNIVTTSFTINSSFTFKEQMYYWRVTAKNTSHTRECDEVFRFYVKAPAVEEVHFDLGETDDWNLHPLGSYADVTVDNSNFFGNNEKTLRISFKTEDTNQGKPESDGWIVVTRTIEKSVYGTDALYFNSFYAGQDATIIIRLVDRDNEYWYCPIQVSTNAKQNVILKFSDFVQRTGDVTVANTIFDYERIKYLEVVFERTFGDGVFLMSGMKAIKFDNYREYFIEKINFNEYDPSLFVTDAYEFDYMIHDDYELEMDYYGTNSLGKPKINGYGFVKLNVNRYMFSGNAVKISLRYEGNAGSNALLRVYEEDTDRWSFKIPFTSLKTDEYTTLIIPYKAFAKSQTTGDGKRQFYYIINLQFGLEGIYSTGKLFWKDFEVVDINSEEYQRDTVRQVASDGLIENFNDYEFNSDMYFIWTQSQNNKDEYMTLNTKSKTGSNNPQCGQFEYKSDMEAALYYLPIKAEGNYSSLSIWMRDASVKSGDDRVSGLTEFSPDVGIYIRLVTGEIYVYQIKKLARAWYEYDIPFDEFTLTNDNELHAPAQPITAQGMTHVGFSFYFAYFDTDGKPLPLYSQSNPVLVDNIYLTNYLTHRQIAKDRIVVMDSNTKLAVVDDFELYENNNDMLDFWSDGRNYEYQNKELSDDVSSQGGHHSLKLQYMTRENSPSYYISPAMDPSVSCRCFKFDLKSEHTSTVYLNFYTTTSGQEAQYRLTLSNVGNEWTEYIVGFGNIKNLSNDELSFNLNYIPFITRISFGVTSYATQTPTLSNIFIDNLIFTANYTSYSTFIKNVIDA